MAECDNLVYHMAEFILCQKYQTGLRHGIADKIAHFSFKNTHLYKAYTKMAEKYKQIQKMYVILFITHHQYHSLTHLKTTAIEIQGIKIIKNNETRRKEHSV